MKYEEIEYLEGRFIIKATDENGKEYFIPKDEANSDYQRYLNPEAEHFTPSLPA